MVGMIQWDLAHRKWVIKNSGTDMDIRKELRY